MLKNRVRWNEIWPILMMENVVAKKKKKKSHGKWLIKYREGKLIYH